MEDKNVVVWQYVLMHNEMRILPFMVNYWKTYADKVIIIDSFSNDGSLEYLSSIKDLDIVLKEYDSNNKLNDENHKNIKNVCWKEARGQADFVVVSDFDETLIAKNGKTIKGVLSEMKERGETICDLKGYNLFSTTFPDYSTELLHTYEKDVVFSEKFSKNIVFDPNKIDEINYLEGAHVCYPTGDVKWNKNNDILMLHIHNLGYHFKCEHYAKGRKRLSDINLQRKWGYEYFYDDEKIKKDFFDDYSKKENIDDVLSN